MLVVQRLPANFRRPVAVLQACTLLFFTDLADDWKGLSGPCANSCAEPTTPFIVSRMGKGKKRHVMFVNFFVANRIRRMEFLHCHIRSGML